MTYQKCVMKETKEKCLKKGRQYYEKKKGYKKWFVINAKHVLERKNESVVEIDIRICLKKKVMQKIMGKIQTQYVTKRQTIKERINERIWKKSTK